MFAPLSVRVRVPFNRPKVDSWLPSLTFLPRATESPNCHEESFFYAVPQNTTESYTAPKYRNTRILQNLLIATKKVFFTQSLRILQNTKLLEFYRIQAYRITRILVYYRIHCHEESFYVVTHDSKSQGPVMSHVTLSLLAQHVTNTNKCRIEQTQTQMQTQTQTQNQTN